MHIENSLGFNLTYCTNIHPGDSWPVIFANLQQFVPALKAKLAPDQPFGIGLRLSNEAAITLLEENQLTIFKAWLAQQQLYVLTLNGFVYGHFYQQPVKDQVYAPDWATPERLNYSLNLVKLLAALTPPGGQRGFSTCPLSYKPWLTEEGTKNTLFQKASLHLAQLVAVMLSYYENENKLLHVDIEPEPDCLIETIDELIYFFNEWLISIGADYLCSQHNIAYMQAQAVMKRHVRVCYDICHAAVEYESPVTALQRLLDNQIQLGKVQVSSALKLFIPRKQKDKQVLKQQLAAFNDPIYLHQVIARLPDGHLLHYADLPQALAALDDSKAEEWRIHFHVPIFLADYAAFYSTQSDINATLQWLLHKQLSCTLEIETYTWNVLPQTYKTDLIKSIEREYRWIIRFINQHEENIYAENSSA